MRPSEILKRLRGFSTPFGGLSWEPPEPEAAVAKRVIRLLEDRRVLYNPSELEQPQHCVMSVIEIRRFLTAELGDLTDGDLASRLSAMRTACRKFLDALSYPDGRTMSIPQGMFHGGYPEWVFSTALGELRGVLGILIAEIAAQYHLDVEGELATILPADPDTGDYADHNMPQRWDSP